MCHIATKRLFSEISTEAFPAVLLPLKGALPSFFQRERLLSCEEGVCAGQHEEGMASGGGEWGGKGVELDGAGVWGQRRRVLQA